MGLFNQTAILDLDWQQILNSNFYKKDAKSSIKCAAMLCRLSSRRRLE